ncbi:DNA-binding domain-containing protein [Pleionea sediminis]|uniref:HvfC/BufC N-terminal domain-containing protein n=1 Tax=Pleionea sediminis TaxID=2569479 RepID=UPI00118531C5|nr:DNA-binding domain-containing protein [Pleionea sediminis]
MHNSNTLKNIQHWMQQALIFPGQVDKKSIDINVSHTSQLTASESLGIYQRSYYARLLSCLREQYPALCYCLGESVFNAFAQDYLFEYPSNSYSLHELGERFPSYLQKTRPDAELPEKKQEAWINFMIDLAYFERQAFIMFDAPGDEANLLEKLSDNMDDNQLKPQRAIALISTRFPVANYYCQVRDNQSPKLPPLHTTYTVLVRKNYKTRLVTMNELEYSLLKNFIEYSNITTAINQVITVNGVNQVELMKDWSKPKGIREQWLKLGVFKLMNR